MVLPHSALRSGQHLKWRSGYYEAKSPSRSRQSERAISADFSIKTPWDLGQLLSYGFFPKESSVAFASFTGGWGDVETHKKAAKPLAPGKVEVWNGLPGEPHFERSVVNLIHDDGTFRSPYAERSNQGPTIVDRRLFFITAYPNDNMYALSDTQRTYPAIGSQDKKKYSVAELNGWIIDDNNIFDVHLGETVAPYVALQPRKAVLPISKDSMTLPLDHSECDFDEVGQHLGRRKCTLDEQALNDNMRSRWRVTERLWDENKKKTDTKTLFQRLNYHNILTSQLDYLRAAGPQATRIAYTQNGRPTATLITDNKAILDTKLYQVRCDSLDEAHYLLAIINSEVLMNSVNDFTTVNWAGKTRDLHKHLWKLPIPKFSRSNEVHVAISQLGKTASDSAAERIRQLRDVIGEDALTVSKARSELRNNWQKDAPTCRAIEEEVAGLIESGASVLTE